MLHPVPQRLRELVGRYAEGVPCLALSIHRNFVSAHEIFPEARFIHLLRDARDCAKSAVAASFSGNVYYGLEPWMNSEESWDRLSRRLKPEQYIEVRYEELVAEPEKVLTEICQFLGLQFERGAPYRFADRELGQHGLVQRHVLFRAAVGAGPAVGGPAVGGPLVGGRDRFRLSPARPLFVLSLKIKKNIYLKNSLLIETLIKIPHLRYCRVHLTSLVLSYNLK